MQRLNIVYATDDNYAIFAGTSMLSLLENNKQFSSINVYILDDNISSDNRKNLKKIAEEFGRSIEFLDVRVFLEKAKTLGVKSWNNASLSSYSRIFIAELLPEKIDKVLYLDCDTLITDSIDELYNTSMGQYPLAAVKDCFRNEYKAVVNLPLEQSYYNSGMLLIDLKNWKNSKCQERIIYHMQNVRAAYPLVDQDIINVVLGKEILPVNNKFNFLSQCIMYDGKNILKIYNLNENIFYSIDDFNQARQHPVIYHFSGNTFGRPWFRNSKHPIKKDYDYFLSLTPWSNYVQQYKKIPFTYQVQMFGYNYLPDCLFILLSLVMQYVFVNINYRQLKREIAMKGIDNT